jgi:class 3 adenylate cyclase/pimeloyl-ACP methyl ester carboxylesterase
MKCSQCRREAPDDALFCPECGARLVHVCAQCGSVNALAHKFCKQCGGRLEAPPAEPPAETRFADPQTYTPRHLAEKILTTRAALEGERKILTVLFTDVSGFTALSERLDPEDVHDLMDQAFELMLGEVHRYEGTVNQFLGDGLMALFGAPIAHEDHAVRAIHAALGIRRALVARRDLLGATRGIELQVRMGLNTGPVLVGSIGNNLRMDYTAVGDTTNLAARLLGLAPPGAILAGADTARAAGPHFVLEPLGELSVKGKSLPVQAWRVEGTRGRRDRLAAALERGITPLVGRERDLDLLRDRFQEVQAGHGQVVFVVGDPGIGKSRLLLEFRQQAGQGARWLTGRCVSYGRAIAYLPVLDIVRDLFDLEESDEPTALRTKVERGIRGLGAELEWTVPLVRALLSLDPGDAEVAAMNPHQRRSRIVDALHALVAAESRQRPLAMLVEDLHWIDTHSEEVLGRLLEGIVALPVLVVLTHRPGYSPPFADRTYHTRITLRALPGPQIGAMVEAALGTSAVPAPLLELIAHKADGNPLFIEEISRSLVEDGTLERVDGGWRLARPFGDVVIPDTVQGVITARIDRLPGEAKAALQVACVIGREFSARLVERVSAREQEAAQALGELRAVELIYETSAYPELAYMFKHALTHDVAYANLVRPRRRELHRRAGEVIEALYRDRLSEFHETLAHHFVQGEAWSKAIPYLIAAAAKARGHYAYRQATRFLTEAVELIDQHGGDETQRSAALEGLGDIESLQARVEAANRAYDRALAAAGTAPDRQRIANKQHRPGSVVRDSARITYYTHGSGEPTVVLMHPLFYGLGTYQPLLERLCQEFRIITVDPRGTGGSDAIPEPYLLRDHVEDARAVIEATCHRPAVLVGVSLAGRLLINFAAAYPALVDRLVVFGATPSARFSLGSTTWRPEVLAHIRAREYDEALRLFAPHVISEPGGRDLVENFIESARALPPAVFRNFFLGPPDPGRNVEALLPGIRVPTLVLHADEDRLVTLEGAQFLAGQIPGAQLYIFKGRGHAAYNTATAEFAEVVRRFVRTGRPT